MSAKQSEARPKPTLTASPRVRRARRFKHAKRINAATRKIGRAAVQAEDVPDSWWADAAEEKTISNRAASKILISDRHPK
jgi:plasmid stability protein